MTWLVEEIRRMQVKDKIIKMVVVEDKLQRNPDQVDYPASAKVEEAQGGWCEEGGGGGHCQVHRCPRKPPYIDPKFLQTTMGSHTTEVGRKK